MVSYIKRFKHAKGFGIANLTIKFVTYISIWSYSIPERKDFFFRKHPKRYQVLRRFASKHNKMILSKAIRALEIYNV